MGPGTLSPCVPGPGGGVVNPKDLRDEGLGTVVTRDRSSRFFYSDISGAQVIFWDESDDQVFSTVEFHPHPPPHLTLRARSSRST